MYLHYIDYLLQDNSGMILCTLGFFPCELCITSLSSGLCSPSAQQFSRQWVQPSSLILHYTPSNLFNLALSSRQTALLPSRQKQSCGVQTALPSISARQPPRPSVRLRNPRPQTLPLIRRPQPTHRRGRLPAPAGLAGGVSLPAC